MVRSMRRSHELERQTQGRPRQEQQNPPRARPEVAPLYEGSEEATDPWAEGACLFNLAPAEWRWVRNAPLVGFLIVAGADGAVRLEERRALVRALEEGRCASSELFRRVCRELYRERDTLVELFVADTFEPQHLAEAYSLVSGKLGPGEAEDFRACLLKLGEQVARASGGVLASWGWLRGVERRALDELAQAFGPQR